MYAVMALLGIMLLTWGVAVWASFEGDIAERHDQTTERPELRKVA